MGARAWHVCGGVRGERCLRAGEVCRAATLGRPRVAGRRRAQREGLSEGAGTGQSTRALVALGGHDCPRRVDVRGPTR